MNSQKQGVLKVHAHQDGAGLQKDLDQHTTLHPCFSMPVGIIRTCCRPDFLLMVGNSYQEDPTLGRTELTLPDLSSESVMKPLGLAQRE